jgi:hypothetical protein
MGHAFWHSLIKERVNVLSLYLGFEDLMDLLFSRYISYICLFCITDVFLGNCKCHLLQLIYTEIPNMAFFPKWRPVWCLPGEQGSQYFWQFLLKASTELRSSQLGKFTELRLQYLVEFGRGGINPQKMHIFLDSSRIM